MKYLKLYEDYKQLDKYKSLLNRNGIFYYVIGSMSSGVQNPTDFKIEEVLKVMIEHYFSDRQFIANNFYNEELKMYKDEFNTKIIEPFLTNFDFFKDEYMNLVKPYTEGKAKYWSIRKDWTKEENDEEFFDKYMLESSLPEYMIDKYIKYRLSYAGDDILNLY
jgi:hypothetical protein